jgi:putative oxidoreductase
MVKTLFINIIGENKTANLVLLGFRVLLSAEMIAVHGIKKIVNWDSELLHLPNPLGLDATLNLLVAAAANLVMPVLVMFGLCTRLAVLPMLSVTLMGYFVVHAHDSLAVRDMPFMYSLCELLLFFLGGGKYALDTFINAYLNRQPEPSKIGKA